MGSEARVVAATAGTCRVCGDRPQSSLRAWGADYDRCARCGTLQKRLTPEESAEIDVTYDPGEYFDDSDPAAIARHLEVPHKVAELRRYAGGRCGPFLDIGCGMGGYLLAAKELGFDVLGFEPSANHARVATELLGLPVVGDYFSSDKVAGRQFDVIMLSHVIEHIYRPKEFLDDILSVLAPGGILLVVTPNADSLVGRLMGPRWPMLVPGDHMTLLGPRSRQWLFDNGVSCSWSTTEYGHEFGSSWAAAVRRRMAGLGNRQDYASGGGNSSAMRRGSRLKRLALKIGLTALSLPFHLAAKGVGRQACLVMAVGRKSSQPAAERHAAGREPIP